jgi:ubiquinone/menaquinone biosynthesis C-methylase UbiE
MSRSTIRPGCALDATVAFFDERAASYDREYDEPTPGGYALRVRREKVLNLFDQQGGRVLDVGCGPGVMAAEIAKRGCKFWGVDPSLNMLEIGRRRFLGNSRVHFLQGEATRLTFPDSSFDAVLCMGVIDAVGDRRRAIREMLRVLRPGGTLLITFTNLRSPYSWWKKFVFYPAVTRYHVLRGRGRKQNGRSSLPPVAKQRAIYEKSAARDLLKTEGAEILRTDGYYFNVFLSPLDEWFPSLSLWVTKQLEEGRWPRPEWFAGGWIIKARKRRAPGRTMERDACDGLAGEIDQQMIPGMEKLS